MMCSRTGSCMSQPYWKITDEVGDGACLLRTIARRVYGTAEQHADVREGLIGLILDTIGMFFIDIENEFGTERIHVLGQQPKIYHSVLNQILAHPSAYYAGHLETAAANRLHGINVIYDKVADSPLAAIPLQNSNELATDL